MTPLDPTTAAMLAILFAGSVLLLLVLCAGLMNRHAAFWDRVAERVFGEGGPEW